MCTPVDKCIDKLGDLAFDKAIKAGKYVCDYNDNLQKLRDKLTELGDCMQIVTREVDAARGRRDEIEVNVVHWQTRADSLKEEIQQLISPEASIQCIACSCPNIIRRYKFSKKAEEKIPDVDELIRSYNDFKDHISQPGSQYLENLQKLKDRLRDLDDCMGTVTREVLAAKGRGEEIKVNVSHWQTDAANLKDGIERLIREYTTKANTCSTERQCPDVMWQWEFSKNAVEKIANVDGLISKCDNFKNEISCPKPRPPELESLSDKNYVKFGSRASVFKDIMEALKKPDMNMIGVFGLGGVGKTTLVKEVGEQMRKDGTFKQVAIAAVSENLNMKEIQSKLATSLDFKLKAGEDDQVGRASELWNKLTNGDKYLIILDDIWEEVEMEAIGIPCTKEKKSCKVVLTSRNEDLTRITMKADRNFRIRELSEPEAMDLFKKKVGKTIENQPELVSLAQEVCRKCKGLPVAINALGAALEAKPYHTWKNALDKLNRHMLTQIKGMDRSVRASLYVSYEMLRSSDAQSRSDAQSCFLLCCLFAEDAEIPIDELMRLCVARSLLAQSPCTLEDARNAVHSIVDDLKSASLLTAGWHEDFVRIHDVIRDVGISIASEEKEEFLIDHGAVRWSLNPTSGPSYSAISLSLKNVEGLPDGSTLEYQKLHTLMIENSKRSDVEFPDNFFNGMTQLEVLTITGMRMRRLPPSLAKLKNLRMLCLNECELDNIAILKDLKSKLEVLSLRGSSIEALPPEIGQLTNLRVFDLQYCRNLTVIPRGVISKLKGLEELYFPFDFNKWEGTIAKEGDTGSRDNVSLEELKQLLKYGQVTTLFIHIPGVVLLPKEDLIFANLKRFMISVGSPFDYWDTRSMSGRTRALKLEGIQLRNDFITLAEKAYRVIFCGIKGLNKVLRNGIVGNKFLVLKYLNIDSCDDDWENFLGEPKSFEQSRGLPDLQPFNKLTSLTIEKFESKYLFSPSATRRLVNLENLIVRSCKIMEGIVGFEGQNDANEIIGEVKFSKLKMLNLGNLPNLISFYVKGEKMGTTTGSSSARAQPLFSEKVIFPVLEELYIDDLGNIINIWDKQSIGVLEKQGSFGQLINLNVSKCKKLMHVFPSNMHPLMKNLKELDVSNCETMEAIIEVASLALERLAGTQEQQVINKDIITFPQLKSVELVELPKLKSFYIETEGFFSHKVAFPVLEQLDVQHLCKITKIWDNQPLLESEKEAKSFCKLISINVCWCVNLEYVLPFYMLSQLKNLQKLIIVGCMMMEVIISNHSKDLALLPNIKSLSTDTQLSFSDKVASPVLEQLAKIQEKEGSNNEIIVFPQLKYVILEELPELKSFYTETEGFFSHKIAFPVLEELDIRYLHKITRIWDSQPLSESEKEAKSFCKLITIYINDCVHLEYVAPFYMLPQLKNLQQLKIWYCARMEAMISNNPKEKEATHIDTIRFPQLKTVELGGWFPNIKSLCTDYTQLSFSNKDAFPVLEKILLQNIEGTEKVISTEDENPKKIDLQIMEFLQGRNESVERDSATGIVFHYGTWCDGCDVRTIAGPRFKSIEKWNYDLCSVCFSIMGVPTEYVRRDSPYDSFKRLCDPERSASGEDTDPNDEALNEDLEIPNEISTEQATKLWKLFLKIFQYGKQSKEECGTSGKASDNSDEALDKDLKLCMNVISMKRAKAWWKMYLQIFRNEKQSKKECGTSGKESHDHNGEEFGEDLEISTNEISKEDALTVLRKIYFENIQNMMESKGLTFPLSLDWECGTSNKENDHNGVKLDEDLEAHTNEISMEDALTVLGKIFENVNIKEPSKEEFSTSAEESNKSGEES